MAKQMIKALAMLVLIVMLSIVTASATKGQTTRQVANIPFDFVVGSEELQAGEYGVAAASSTGMAVKISGDHKSVFRLSSTITANRRAETGKLVFHRYGNRYFLAEIWTPGESEGRQLMKSKDEKSVERELAAAKSSRKYERVEIALAR
jgi:hypothetical protein